MSEDSCQKHCTLDSVDLKGLQLRDCIACRTLSFWLWLEARAFFIDYSAGFRLRHSSGGGSLAFWQCQASS